MASRTSDKKSSKKTNIAQNVRALVEKTITDAGYTLWDVEYVKEGTDYNLVITIDKKPFVTIEDCEKVTRLINPILDEADPIQDSYYLEVFSAGTERDLVRPEHFAAYNDCRIKVGLFAVLTDEETGGLAEASGTKTLEGVLKNADEGRIRVALQSGEVEIDLKKCSYVRADDSDEYEIVEEDIGDGEESSEE